MQACAKEMRIRNIHQWDDSYPSMEHVENDISAKSMYSVYNQSELIGVIVMDAKQSVQYKDIDWSFVKKPILIIHRLAIHPKYYGNGYGKYLMQFAENKAKLNGFKSIRLDAYKHNDGLQQFYVKLNYRTAGEIALEYTNGPFVCFEKKIHSDS
jgi:ribosomal protein S18 acetylase RimI-like enzyme